MRVAIQAAELYTKRLVLRPLQLADAQQTQRLFSQWEIVKNLNAIVPWPYPDDGALNFYRDVALPARRGMALDLKVERIAGATHRCDCPAQKRVGQSRFLDGPAMAQPGPDDRGCHRRQ